jgi:nucleoid-associated protein YgaU
MKLKYLIVALLLGAFPALTVIAQTMTRAEWQQQMKEATASRESWQAKVKALENDVATLKKTEAEKEQALNTCHEELLSLLGQKNAQLKEFSSQLDRIGRKEDELSAMPDHSLWERRTEVDSVQAMIDGAKQSPDSWIDANAKRLADLQSRLSGLRSTLKSIAARMENVRRYTVGTWAKNRDCLWNISKKGRIYRDPFLWPKIWQANRGEIKNPDLLYPGEKLMIPEKSPLTAGERKAENRYWAVFHHNEGKEKMLAHTAHGKQKNIAQK